MIRTLTLYPTLVLLLLLAPLPSAGLASALLPTPSVAADAWILMDARTGFSIGHNADEPLPPASLTKLMTSYVLAHELARGRVSNDDMVLISKNAWAQNPVFAGSSLMWIEAGKTVRLEDLHRGIVVSSGNDASVAVAEHIAGSEESFAQMMNEHARLLGMDNSYFVNSHGLHADEHYTTARDMAILAAAFIRDFPEEYLLYRESEFTYNNIRQYNRNVLVMEDPSIDGLKTGYTSEAGYCLVASSARQGMRLVSVVMGADSEMSRNLETRKLFNHGFRFYETRQIYSADEQLATARLWRGQSDELRLGMGRDLYMTIPRGSRDELKAVMEIDEVIMAPVSAGDVHGVLRASLGGETLLEEPLVALEGVERAGFFGRLWDSVVLFIVQWFDD